MSPYLLYALVFAIGHSSYACGRAYGWKGLFVFLGALLVLAVSGEITPEGGGTGMPTRALVYGAYVLAAVCGLLGVGNRAAALRRAGKKPPKSG